MRHTQFNRFNVTHTNKETPMKRTRMKLALGLIGAAFCLTLASSARAGTSANLDITVSISATKSLAVGTTSYDFGAQAVSIATVSATAIDVNNDSNGILETYTIQGANAASTGGGTTWTLVASTGTLDQYMLAAQFSTARPANSAAAWSSDDLTTSAVACSSTQFGNGTLGEAGTQVIPQSHRNLWFRLGTPNVVSDVTQRKATLTLAVQ